MHDLKLCSWNICGLRDKLQDPVILKFILDFDIVWLLETKKYFKLNVPGFQVYQNVSRYGAHRGGVVMLVRAGLVEKIQKVDMSSEGQIWIFLSWQPILKLGGVYIPPEDSPYYQPTQYGVLAAHTVETGRVIALGDLNARVGDHRTVDIAGTEYNYSGVKDHTVNNHGRTLMNTCKNNSMVVLNNLQYKNKTFQGNLSYKKRETWISEIDVCIASNSSLDLVRDLCRRQDVKGSDHAPLCVTLCVDVCGTASPKELLDRASTLGQVHQRSTRRRPLRKSTSYKTTNIEGLTNTLQGLVPPNVTQDGDVNVTLEEGCRTIIDTAATFAEQHSSTDNRQWDETQPRWQRLMDTKDSSPADSKISVENGL